MVAAQNATQRSLAASPDSHPQSATDTTFSRDQIAQALGSKDPAWFRQTADRGQGSAAYRKNQVEDDDRLDMSSVKAQLPGLSTSGDRSVSNTSATGGLASPPPLGAPLHDDQEDASQSGNAGRTSPNRSTSPTKGMGGFVQSAMMKRSDSVKRWSVTSPPGLARADSIASTRAFDRGATQGVTRPRGLSRADGTILSSSRPTSRQGEQEITRIDTSNALEQTPTEQPVEPTKAEDEDALLPTSPSKTMDPRRWSPTKTSWLESALNKPESPKPQSKPASPAQPAWRVEFNKKGEQTTSPTDKGRTGSFSHKHQVSIGGLMRSTPMGNAAKTNTTGLGGIYSPPPNANRPAFGHGSRGSISVAAAKAELGLAEDVPQPSSEPQDAEPLKRSSVTSPTTISKPAPKPKPETPPKKDFRSTLKQRAVDSPVGQSSEPEFKNVFGNLRRTNTQKYVAPDELKDNIMRGKMALNQTGGPKKSERKDEFKDAIQKKKEDFKKAQAEGKGVTRNPSSATEKVIPEGLARRAELGRSKSISRPAAKPEPVEPNKASSPKPVPGPKRVTSQTVSSPKSPAASSPSTSPELKKIERVSTESDVPKPAAAPRPLPTLHKETSAPSRLQQGRVGGGKLADRFNPALAGMLARGPPPMASNGGKSSDDSKPQSSNSVETTEPAAGPQLTHMTKGRARGPKRKAPSSAAKQTSSGTVTKTEPAKVQMDEDMKPAGLNLSKPGPAKPQDESQTRKENLPIQEAEKPAPLSIQQQVAAKASLRGKPSPIMPVSKPAEESQPSTPLHLRRQPSPDKAPSEPPSPLKPHKTGGDAPGSPRKLDMKRMSRFLDEQNVEPVKEPIKLRHQRTGSRSPVKMFERPLPEPVAASQPVMVPKPLATSPPVTSQPIPAAVPREETPAETPVKSPVMTSKAFTKLPPPPTAAPREEAPVGTPVKSPTMASKAFTKSPPLKPKPSMDQLSRRAGTPQASMSSARPLPTIPPPDAGITSPPDGTPVRSPSRHGVDVSTLLSDFFGPEQPKKDYKVDPAEILMSTPGPEAKVRSTGVQLSQLTGDGKRVPVPPHFERVLFDQDMYLCAHEFAYSNGRPIVEVYFWIGDEVPESTAQDAQLFAQREARSLGAKLIKLRQGKETSEFLQALGGIVVTRRGTSSRYDSLAPSILCGRRYLGQITFDEVDFAPVSLCAGFPYLVTKEGKCHIWKGKGSDVDEISSARLLGMDLTLTGELFEHEDGAESPAFWELFDGGAKPHSADHWKLKPNYSKYCSRLFCSDADSRQQIFEVRPFTQSDLSPYSVYVLDAFFEIYIIVGMRAQSQYASFRNALNFAQEYAILAAGMEDRPFVPISTVVLEGIPRDMKSVFRKWTNSLSPTITNPPSTGLRRKKSLKLVPLTQALQALKD
jgi:hypothetical protein